MRRWLGGGQFISRDPVEGEARLPITWGAYQYGRYNPYRYTDPNGECDRWRDCGTKIAGDAIGFAVLTTVELAKSAGSVLDYITDSNREFWLQDEAAKRRNRERAETYEAVIGNIDKMPAAVVQAVANIDEKAQAEDAKGNTFTAAMLRGNYAGEIGLAIAVLPQGVRSAAGFLEKGMAIAGNATAKQRVVAKVLAQELQKAEPVLAAKAPTAAAPQVRPHVGETTPKLLAETDRLVVGRETQSAVNTAQVGGSEATSARGFADYLSNSSALEVRRELISITADLRASLPSEFQEVGNLAVAKVNVEGFSGNMKSFSRFADGEFGYTRLPDGPTILEPIKIGKGGIVDGKDAYLRNVDGEFKILENFSRSLGEDYSAMERVDLFTELRACTSCSGAIMQFRQRYPGI